MGLGAHLGMGHHPIKRETDTRIPECNQLKNDVDMCTMVPMETGPLRGGETMKDCRGAATFQHYLLPI